MRKPSFLPSYDQKKGRYYISIPPVHSETSRRKREYFETKKEAEQRSGELLKLQSKSVLSASRAGAELIAVALNYHELFQMHYGYSGLEEACEDLMRIKDREASGGTFSELLDGFEAEHSPSWGERSSRSWKWLRKKLGALEGQPVVTLDSQKWLAWLTENAEQGGWGDRTYNDIQSRLWSVWERARKLQLVERNPIDPIRKRKIKREEKAVYTPDQVRKLMNCAWEHDRDLVPFFAIAIFAGLRPDEKGEIARLQWEDVNFEEKWIRVTFKENKTNAQRFVRLEANLAEWLKPWKGSKGSVLPTNFRSRRRAVTRGKYQAKEGASEEEWKELVPYGSHVRDITRHTYGSYFDAMFRNRDLLKEHMGHADFQTYDQHYRNARTKKEAEEFWNIRPPRSGDAGGEAA